MFRKFISFLLCLALLLSVVPVLAEEEPLSGVTDDQAPAISDFVLSENGKTVRPNDTLHVSVKIEDRSRITSVYINLRFRPGEGYEGNTNFNINIDPEYDPAKDLYVGEAVVPDGLPNGLYAVSSIDVYDEFGNNREIGGSKLGTFTLAGSKGPSQSEKYPIVMTEDGQTVRPGSTVHFILSVPADTFKRVYLWLQNIEFGGNSKHVSLEYNEAAARWEGEFTFTADMNNGVYGINEYCLVTEVDDSWDYNYYYDNTQTVTLTGASEDYEGPRVLEFSFTENKQTVGPGAELHFRAVITDDLSDADYAEVYMYYPGEWSADEEKGSDFYWEGIWHRSMWCNLERSETDPQVFEGVMELSETTVNATYSLELETRDSVGNYAWDSLNGDYWFTFEGPDIISEDIAAFVERCYGIILGRLPDPSGMQTWGLKLATGKATAAEIINSIVSSAEFKGKNLSNADQVEILYQAMLGRNSDAAGKENWVKKLENGQTLAHIINGFCRSKEFRGICHNYGINAGAVDLPDDPQTPDGKIKAFVTRCYSIILGRNPDEGGLNTWFNELKSGRKAAAEIIDRFVNSPEFLGKNYSNGDAVEILYKTMLNRGSDPAGKQNWISKLENGQTLAHVINGFCRSPEFVGICESYGIKPGSVTINTLVRDLDEPVSRTVVGLEDGEETASAAREIVLSDEQAEDELDTAVMVVYYDAEKVQAFVKKCYQEILGRGETDDAIGKWAEQILNGAKTPDQIIRGFLFSGEFGNKEKSSEELVKILYKVYMNRDADPEGLATWTAKLDGGMTLKELADAFAKTNEYRKMVQGLEE